MHMYISIRINMECIMVIYCMVWDLLVKTVCMRESVSKVWLKEKEIDS